MIRAEIWIHGLLILKCIEEEITHTWQLIAGLSVLRRTRTLVHINTDFDYTAQRVYVWSITWALHAATLFHLSIRTFKSTQQQIVGAVVTMMACIRVHHRIHIDLLGPINRIAKCLWYQQLIHIAVYTQRWMGPIIRESFACSRAHHTRTPNKVQSVWMNDSLFIHVKHGWRFHDNMCPRGRAQCGDLILIDRHWTHESTREWLSSTRTRTIPSVNRTGSCSTCFTEKWCAYVVTSHFISVDHVWFGPAVTSFWLTHHHR